MRHDFIYNQSIAGCYTEPKCYFQSIRYLDHSVPLIEYPKPACDFTLFHILTRFHPFASTHFSWCSQNILVRPIPCLWPPTIYPNSRLRSPSNVTLDASQLALHSSTTQHLVFSPQTGMVLFNIHLSKICRCMSIRIACNYNYMVHYR